MNTFFNISKVISEEKIETVFQPIVNIEKSGVFAEEALSRGIDFDGQVIEPESLFQAAFDEDMLYELDLLCCKKAVEIFAKKRSNVKSILFINVNAQTAIEDAFHDELLKVLAENGLKPNEIGIEFLETIVLSMPLLTEAVNKYREEGFVIAIDDFGCKESNIDRLLNVHPDIIKIDKHLIQGIQKDIYKKSIVTSLHVYANMTGALCLAEGVESCEEIQCCYDIGIVLFQGFGISKPLSDFEFFENSIHHTTSMILSKVQEHKTAIYNNKSFIASNMEILAEWLIKQLSYDDLDWMIKVLEDFVALYPEIESLSIFNSIGRQVTKKILKPKLADSKWTPIFSLQEKCLSLIEKPYIIKFIASKKNYFLSDTYISIISRLPVRTFTINLRNIPSQRYILCISFYESEMKTA